jgi:hypothetical protein
MVKQKESFCILLCNINVLASQRKTFWGKALYLCDIMYIRGAGMGQWGHGGKRIHTLPEISKTNMC